jgi:antitoxin ParD1/3/4
MTLPSTPEIEQLINAQLATGKYAAATEVILAGLRLLEERERIYQGRFEELQQAVRIGIEEADRGELIDSEVVFSRLRERLEHRRLQEHE